MSRPAAIDYLRPPRGAPWRWEENGNVLAWSDGTTLAFWPEIRAILDRFEPTGLPWFATIALTLAACRGKLPTVIDHARAELVGTGRGDLINLLSARGTTEAFLELNRLNRLPRSLLETPENKALLVEALLEHAPRLSASETIQIVTGIEEGLTADELNGLPTGGKTFNIAKALQTIAAGLSRHSDESLLLRLGTSLDALPAPADVDLALPRGERARRLLAEVAEDDDLGSLATVVRDLRAALRLPRTLTRADESACGGVADIGNRGSPDRLLLSELAHDDLTLAIRVALHEALYLRREPPAHRPDRTLSILLDCGVRMWGVPRVLATAAALTLTMRHPDGCAAECWRAEGEQLRPLDLLSREGLVAHLGTLGTTAHPGPALPAWSDALNRSEADVDAVIITHRDSFRDPGFKSRVALLRADRTFALVVDHSGALELFSMPWGSPRPIVSMIVDPNRLFPRAGRTAEAAPVVDPRTRDNFPAIFRSLPFPLLLPVDSRMQLACAFAQGGACVTNDRRLLFWQQSKQGALQLGADLPAGRCPWIGRDEAGDNILAAKVHAKHQVAHIVVARVDGSGARTVRIENPGAPLGFHIEGDAVLCLFPDRAMAVSIDGSEVIGTNPTPHATRHVHARYYLRNNRLCFATWSGTGMDWPEVPGIAAPAAQVVTAFDSRGEGPWVLLRSGDLVGPGGGATRLFSGPVRAANVNADGTHLVAFHASERSMEFATRDKHGSWARDTTTHRRAGVPHVFPPQVVPPTRGLSKALTSIGVSRRGEVLLFNEHGPKIRIDASHPNVLTALSPSYTPAPDLAMQAFTPFPTSPRFGCSLKSATWPGGSQAWLDSRGLLHLRSSKTELPEVTIVLSLQSFFTSWCSDGTTCGDRFFIQDQPAPDGLKKVRRYMSEFCEAV